MSRHLALALALALAVPWATVGPRPAVAADQASTAAIVFSEVEKRLIHDYYQGQAPAQHGKKDKSGLPPGLAKKQSLPPGLQKQLQRNGHLPPGLEKRALPGDLRSRLYQRTGIEPIIVDNDVLLVVAATGLILDIIHDVVND